MIAALYVAVDFPLRRLAVWAEAEAASYPWSEEDYLRFLLPTLFENRGVGRLLITGPSEAREDLLYQRFGNGSDGPPAYQGGIAGGSFQDLLAALEYVRLEYGEDALPGALVLGISARFVANIPNEPAPVIQSINRYSSRWRVRSSLAGPVLEPKSSLAGAVSRARFQTKQSGRYRAAVCSAALQAFGGNAAIASVSPETGPAGLMESLAWKLHTCSSPKQYYGFGARATAEATEGVRRWLTSPYSFWPRVHAWDPYADSAMVRAQLGRLVRLAREHDIQLYLVNLPEHPENRARYNPEYYRRYLEVVTDVIGETPFLDLRELLDAADYVDHAHADYAAAGLVTDRTVEFIRSANRDRSRPTRSAAMTAADPEPGLP